MAGEGAGPSAPEPIKGLLYGEILNLGDLLRLQRPAAGSNDSLFFMVIHQTAELWFLVILHELELARDAMTQDQLLVAAYRLRRVVAIMTTLIAQIQSLSTLDPAVFQQLRTELGDSSGLQSAQFREIEFLSGLKDPRYLDLVRVTDAERQRLKRRLAEPSLRDALCELLGRRHMTLAEITTAAARDPVLSTVAGLLLDHDESFARWRAVHAVVVERLIGDLPGTGGSSGVSYLRSTVAKRFFPELWGSASGNEEKEWPG